MNFQQDWLMRQIEMLVRFVANVIFKEKRIEYVVKENEELTKTDVLFNKTRELIEQGLIKEAEEQILSNLNTGDIESLRLTIDFYQTLNQLSDEKLIEGSFSREDIDKGLLYTLKEFGIEDLYG